MLVIFGNIPLFYLFVCVCLWTISCI